MYSGDLYQEDIVWLYFNKKNVHPDSWPMHRPLCNSARVLLYFAHLLERAICRIGLLSVACGFQCEFIDVQFMEMLKPFLFLTANLVKIKYIITCHLV